MWYRIGADLVLVVHLLFIGFVVGGAFLAWRWPRIIWVQLPARVYGALVEFVGFTCPLTSLQNYLLRRAGDSGYRGGFISHYLVQVIYPPRSDPGNPDRAGIVRRAPRRGRIRRLPAPARVGLGSADRSLITAPAVA